MTLPLNLGDVVYDNFFNTTVVIAARKDVEGKPVVLAGYEDHPEVERVLKFVGDASDRVAIILEHEDANKQGKGYYTWTDDGALAEVTK